MDQDSFRLLLQTPRPGGSTLGVASGSRSLLAIPRKKKSVDVSQPAFKPRKVKKPEDSKYRDRAAERRVGEGNDFAHVEAVLDDFEKKNADNDDKAKVEAQRKYLGGDSEHSVLVKGLDFALLEQNKARTVFSNEDVDALDQAFLESSSHVEPTAPRKRTRQELIEELKQQRAQQGAPKSAEEEARLLEAAKQSGKFKPIGFKPIGSSTGKKKKSIAKGGEGEKKKKKQRKIEGEGESTTASSSMPPPPVPSKPTFEAPKHPEPINDDFDIFVDAADYQGIEIGDDDEDYEAETLPRATNNSELEEGEEASSSSIPRRWISSDEPEPVRGTNLDAATRSPPPVQNSVSDDEEMEEQPPMRLAPLESSALPSIKDFLDMDKAAGSYDKKRKRKDKKKSGGGGGDDDDEGPKKKSVEAKVDRDYKRLKSYTDKKTASGSK